MRYSSCRPFLYPPGGTIIDPVAQAGRTKVQASSGYGIVRQQVHD